MYYEEVDLCFRLRRAGWDIHFTPATEVTHIGGASTSQRRPEMLARLGLSEMDFHRRHHRGIPAGLAIGLLRGTMLYRFCRDWLGYRLVRQRVQRRRGSERISPCGGGAHRHPPRAGVTQLRLLTLAPFPPRLDATHGGSRAIAELLARLGERHRSRCSPCAAPASRRWTTGCAPAARSSGRSSGRAGRRKAPPGTIAHRPRTAPRYADVGEPLVGSGLPRGGGRDDARRGGPTSCRPSIT